MFNEINKLLVDFFDATQAYDEAYDKIINKYKKLWKKYKLPEEVFLDEKIQQQQFPIFTYDNAKSVVQKITLLPNGEFKLRVKTISSGNIWDDVDVNFVKRKYLILALNLAFSKFLD